MIFAEFDFSSGFRQELMDWINLALVQPKVLTPQVRGQNCKNVHWFLQKVKIPSPFLMLYFLFKPETFKIEKKKKKNLNTKINAHV